jgi:2-oxoisovalerate dehydrogenase E1 component subunit alpha
VDTSDHAQMLQMVAPDGTPVGEADVGLGDDDLRAMLRLMVLARRLDRECMALQAEGELTVYPPFEGQEAAQVGSAFALGPRDFAFPSFRELAAALVRGVDVVEYLRYHRGIWHGGQYDPYASGFAPICVPLATQLPHAVGWALGTRLDGGEGCALAYFGEGAAAEGDFHEAANIAAVFGLPVVFLCQTNGWAISVPLEGQAAAPIVARAAGYGFPGVLVDGNDVLAVHAATRAALGRARAGDGPTLVEAITYRIGPHHTSDDPSRYRDEQEVERWRARDPIARYRRFLLATGVLDEARADGLEQEAEAMAAEVRAGITAVEAPAPAEIFEHVFGNPPRTMLEERREALGDG